MVIRILIIILFIGCGDKAISLEDNLRNEYLIGIELFDNKKYNKAKSKFEFIVMNNPGSKFALDAQFYLAETLFELEEYYQSEINFDQFARFSNDLEKVEEARYKLCLCIVRETLGYKKDQSKTTIAIERLQEFIDDYPNSSFYDETALEINRLRNKVARKNFETARLYLKLGEYQSALIYLNDVLFNYYDLDISDDVRILIIFTYIIDGKRNMALDYLEREKNNFFKKEKIEEAASLINDTVNGFEFSHYVRLYK